MNRTLNGAFVSSLARGASSMKPRQTLFLFALTVVLCCAFGTSAHAQPVQGYVDLHSHLMAEHSFGGGYFWGTVDGSMESAVPRCDGNFPYRTHASTIPILTEFEGADTGWHLGKRRGYDLRHCKYFLGIPIPGTCPKEHFEDWPRWNAKAHQQMWQGWLKQAHQGGLRIMVVSLAESNFLCRNTAEETRRYDCDEMASIRRQAVQAYEFAIRNSSWVGIATSPAQARALIQQGKLALVLAVEATQLFPTGDAITQLDELRALGVRSMQVTHHANNRFAGAAPIPTLVKLAKAIDLLTSGDITDIDEFVCRDSLGNKGECDGDSHLNERGLTAEGVSLVKAMMNRGMLLDVAHLSRKSFEQAFQLAIAHPRGTYPLFYSHAHMWDPISHKEERHEKFIQQQEIHMITKTDGMVGLRTGPEKTVAYANSSPVVNSCQGSARSFAQSLMYAVDNGLTVGLGADFNGYIEQMKPRFQFPLPLRIPLPDPIDDCLKDYAQISNAGGPTEFQKKGLAHVGLLPQLMSDLQTVGVPAPYLEHLNSSAENFLKMWERSVSLSSIPNPPGPGRSDDFVATIEPPGGPWGDWQQTVFCKSGGWAIGYQLKVEGSQGSGDDTALNSVKLLCQTPSGVDVEWISGFDGGWGTWGNPASCAGAGNFIKSARLRVEGSQGRGDDTAANDVEMGCNSGGTIHTTNGQGWGSWYDWASCPANTAVCGLSIRFEPSQGRSDDTAMNALRLHCCQL